MKAIQYFERNILGKEVAGDKKLLAIIKNWSKDIKSDKYQDSWKYRTLEAKRRWTLFFYRFYK
jgi:hypothetical protein